MAYQMPTSIAGAFNDADVAEAGPDAKALMLT